jgi:hypothetical protein
MPERTTGHKTDNRTCPDKVPFVAGQTGHTPIGVSGCPPRTGHSLDDLINAAAKIYGYDPDDLERIKKTANRDPIGMRIALESDPLILATAKTDIASVHRDDRRTPHGRRQRLDEPTPEPNAFTKPTVQASKETSQ